LPDEALSATIYVSLGDLDRGWKVMENLYQGRDGGLMLLNVDPCFDVLKSDPRFQQLSQRIGLPH
jgi:hypothetical protein